MAPAERMAAAGQTRWRPQDRDVEVGMRDIVCLFVSIRGDDDRIDDGRPDMPQYLLSIYQPDGDPPAPHVLEPIMRNVGALRDEMQAAGVWVFAAGLHPSSASTVVRVQNDRVLMTDGPFAEAKEHIGGFTVIKVADLDAALEWGGKLARATTLPIEVRPFR